MLIFFITKHFYFFARKHTILQYLWPIYNSRKIWCGLFITQLYYWKIWLCHIFSAMCYWHINGLPTRFVASTLRFCNERVKRQAKRDLSIIIQLKFSTSSRRKDNQENRVTVLRTSPGSPRFVTIYPSFSLGFNTYYWGRLRWPRYYITGLPRGRDKAGDSQGRKWRLPQRNTRTAERLLKNIDKLRAEFSLRNLTDIVA